MPPPTGRQHGMPLPNFILIGAYKAGTTSLHGYLSQHPDVFMTTVKEPNFLALEQDPRAVRYSEKNVYDIESYQRLFAGSEGFRAVGEASPLYLQHPGAPVRMRHYMPEARLIAILRQPCEAYFSNYLMKVREAQTRANFDRHLDQFVASLADDPDRGPFYGRQIARYLDLFRRDQLQVHLYEDLQRDPRAVLRQIFQHIGVDPDFAPTLERRNVARVPRSKTLNRLLRSGPVKALLPKGARTRLEAANTRPTPRLGTRERQALIDVFQADIEYLETLIGRDLADWRARD